jgi:predicted ATPase
MENCSSQRVDTCFAEKTPKIVSAIHAPTTIFRWWMTKPAMRSSTVRDGIKRPFRAAAAIAYLTGERALATLEQTYRYHRRAFLTPPWPELYSTDDERRHDFDVALAEYARLLEVYPSLGYEVYILPKVGISERADYLLKILG